MASFSASAPPAVIVTDPISSGRELARRIINRGFTVIALWSVGSQSAAGLGDCDVEFVASINEIEANLESTLNLITQLPYTIIACIVGCECGVELNDAVSERLNLATNGTNQSIQKRDKWEMQERMRECGLRAIKQTVARSVDEIKEFVEGENLRNWIIKPRRDAGSNGVYKCESMEQARQAFEKITNMTTIFGEGNSDVLVQEFLVGREYVVDTVSCQGQHKVAVIWEQDKRTLHGSPFVYYDSHTYETTDGVREKAMADYVFKCIDALGIIYGPCHAEVMWLDEDDSPCLVEVGARLHGAGGNFPAICDPIIGYNQIDLTIDAYLSSENFFKIPTLPTNIKGYGVEYFFVCYTDGILESMDFSRLSTLQSFLGVDMHRSVGERLYRTIDLMTSPGVVRLSHSDKDLCYREKFELRSFEESLFTIRPEIEDDSNKCHEVSQEANAEFETTGSIITTQG